MRLLGHAARFLVMTLVILWFGAAYACGRLGAAFTRGAEARRSAIAALRGRVLRRAMTSLGATFVKLGQVISSRPDLIEAETIAELRKLQDRVPPFPIEDVRRIVAQDLGGPVEACFAELDPVPIAAASVSQVHRARMKDGREVAVKVLRPDVRARVERDAAIVGFFARIAALSPTVRLSDPVGHVREFFAGVLDQTDLRLEIANYQRFRQSFAGTPGIHFPFVVSELSSARVMTMELLRGHKLDALPGGDPTAVARRLQQVFLKMVFEDGFLHADLHPGNMLLLDNGDIAIFDVGLVKELPEAVLLQAIDFSKCLVMGSAGDFVAHIRRFHTYRENVHWDELRSDLEGFLVRFRAQNAGQLELGELLGDILALGRRYRVRPLSEMALVMVAMVTAEGLGKQLNPSANLFQDTAAFLAPLLAKRGLDVPIAAA